MLYVFTQPKSLPENYQPRFPFWTSLHCGTHCGNSYIHNYTVFTDETPITFLYSIRYSSGPNNSVVLNKRVGGIFFSPFKGQIACFWENFKSY
jgi:hypothetical protein